MAFSDFGGANISTIGFTDNFVYSDGIPIPFGNPAENGTHPVIVNSIRAWVSGRGAGRNGTFRLEQNGGPGWSQSTSGFFVSAASSAQLGLFIGGITALFSNGDTVRFVIDMDGSFYFGRGGGGTSFDSFGTAFAGTLGGTLGYVKAPASVPGLPILTPMPNGQIRIQYNAPSDTGDVGLSGFGIHYSTDGTALAGGVAQTTFNVPVTQDVLLSGFTPGQTYFFRVSAHNQVTDAAGTTSVWGNIVSTQALAGGRVAIGGTWHNVTPRTDVGTTWAITAPKVAIGGTWRTVK